ncbi:MAG: SPOR domain-containing protein [Lachnospiraceae bacterium]|nr:SPOR domain-containing protein [Lachnospiraceae bacterium]
MKKSIVLAACLITAAGLILAGCGKKSGSDLKDKLDISTAGEAVGNTGSEEAEEDKGTKDDKKVKKSGEKPILLKHRGFKYEHNSNGQLVIDHKYSYLSLGYDQGRSNKELAVSLEEARDELLALEEDKRKDELKALEENEMYSFEEGFNTYVRRADPSVVSFVTEYSAVGEFDGQYYTEYTSHNYYTGSGEEIKLSDIVKDEDAFFDILAGRFKEYFDYANKNVYFTDADADTDTVKKNIKKYMDSGSCSWTLDPYGVTFFLNAYTGLPEGVSQTVFFTDDEDGSIFNEEFSEDAGDEWVTQIPEHIGCYIDTDDDGEAEYVNAYPLTDMKEYEGSEEYYVSGLHVGIDGEIRNFKTVMEGGTVYYDTYLMHKKGKTVLLECHDEYDSYFITSYKLAGGIDEADALRGAFEWSQDDNDSDRDTMLPHYLPLDMDSIRVLMEEDNEARDMTPDMMSIDEDGKMELASGDFEHFVRAEDDGSVTVDVGESIDPFYGVWVGSYKDRAKAVELNDVLKEKGFEPDYLFAPEWDNLSDEPYYCITAGICHTKEAADVILGEAKKAGYKDAYIKFTGERTGHRIYYIVYDEGKLDISPDEVIINDVQIEELSGGSGDTATLIVDKDTVFDESCETEFFGNYKQGDTPLEWYNTNQDMIDKDVDEYISGGSALKGVFEVSITGNHVDRFYGSYWWD